jgi:hypothetical protein
MQKQKILEIIEQGIRQIIDEPWVIEVAKKIEI